MTAGERRLPGAAGKMGREYLVKLWDNVASVRGVTRLERSLQKKGFITLRAHDDLSGLFAGSYVTRQITQAGRVERDAHVVDVAAKLPGWLRDVLEEARAAPLLDVTKSGAPRLRLSVRRAWDTGLVCSRRQNGSVLHLALTHFGCAVRKACEVMERELARQDDAALDAAVARLAARSISGLGPDGEH